ncbi:E3 ubiquitin-protein ligase ARIH2-like [Diadema antillarum]|uniref:E3 ubiquitin-protein ligase ARIH2-like n=1 Tax=Diadema antillarum TaxID=105358 RepID=UPI003A87BB4C
MAEAIDDYDDDNYDSEEDEDDDDDMYNDYYDDPILADDPVFCEEREPDPEAFDYTCVDVAGAKAMLKNEVDLASENLKVQPRVARALLMAHQWDLGEVQKRTDQDIANILVETGILPRADKSFLAPTSQDIVLPAQTICPVCTLVKTKDELRALSCGHFFCSDCWITHLHFRITDGVSTEIRCMANECHMRTPEDFVLSLLKSDAMKRKFEQFAFRDYIKSHWKFRFCPGADCDMVVHAKEVKSKRVDCPHCRAVWCFKCSECYHAPAGCETIKKWLTKCADDSETANYISAHTKDCPKCNICIEKNGGCNHMQCSRCKHDFCWMCLGDWKSHGSEFYECSRYKENPNIANESANVKAREALKKYLFYFERWENHSKSLRLEAQTLRKINERIEDKVMNNMGTWIDWQYLLDAAALLAKCRYTLQYTYPYAYFMDSGPRKKLFEYQQAQLEAEIEDLSWKVERAETYDRGDLENQMDVGEKRRQTLLKDFHTL